jgi:hypothetical protein
MDMGVQYFSGVRGVVIDLETFVQIIDGFNKHLIRA